jgi:hypothetical protein
MGHTDILSLLMASIYWAKPQALLYIRKKVGLEADTEKTTSPECRVNHCMTRASRSPEKKVAKFSYWRTIEAAS